MEKITKLFRSRYFLAALAIILEFAQLLAVFILLYEYIILFLLPVIADFVLMLLSSNETSKKQFLRCEKPVLERKPYQRQTEQIHLLREKDAEAYVQANYLYHAAAMPCQGAASVCYITGKM